MSWPGSRQGDKGDVPRGTSVLGIDIGGLDRSDAAARLHAGLDGKPALDQPITVHVTGDSAEAADAQVTPDQVGLGVDIDATVAAAEATGDAVAPRSPSTPPGSTPRCAPRSSRSPLTPPPPRP